MRWERVQPLSRQGQDGALGEMSGPGKRWGLSCNAINEGRYLYVFGGYGKDNCQTNHVHVFDTGTTFSSTFLFFFVDLIWGFMSVMGFGIKI